jgi:hypothetical protein
MALEKLPLPGDDAYDKGFLNKDYATKVVKRINRDEKVIASTFPNGIVRESNENRILDLSEMLGKSQEAYIIVNGELVYGFFPFRKLNDPNA